LSHCYAVLYQLNIKYILVKSFSLTSQFLQLAAVHSVGQLVLYYLSRKLRAVRCL